MNILVITNKLGSFSGWERYSGELIENLHKQGVSFTVLCNKKNQQKDIEQIELLPDPLQFKRNFFLSLWYVAKLMPYWKKIKNADAIHCHVEPYAFFAFVLACVTRKKFFLTIHGTYAVKLLRNPVYRFLQLWAYRRAEKIISISDFTLRRLNAFRNFDNAVVIPNGVSAHLIEKPKAMPYKPRIVSVGALKHRKGYHLMLPIVKTLQEKIPDLECVIVGNQNDKTYYDSLRTYVHEQKLENTVKFLSNISDQELRALYNSASVFMLLPVSDANNFEGFGLVYLEANAHGVPTLGSYDSGAEAAIRDGISGFLVDPRDTSKAVEILMRLFTDKNLYSIVSEGAIEWSREHSWDIIAGRYKKLYSHDY